MLGEKLSTTAKYRASARSLWRVLVRSLGRRSGAEIGRRGMVLCMSLFLAPELPIYAKVTNQRSRSIMMRYVDVVWTSIMTYRATDLTETVPRISHEDAARGDSTQEKTEPSSHARFNPDDLEASPSHHTILPYVSPFRTDPAAYASSSGTTPIYSSYTTQ